MTDWVRGSVTIVAARSRASTRRPPHALLALITMGLIVIGLSACDIRGAVGEKGLGCNPQSMIAADDSTQSFYADGLETESQSALAYARGQIDTTHVDTSQSGTLTSSTDVRVLDGAYTNYCGYVWWTGPSPSPRVAGLTTCEALNAQGECDQHYVRLSATFVTYPGVPTSLIRHLVLHELGHSLGLVHVRDSSDLMYKDGNDVTVLSDRNKKALNGYYD